MPALFVLRFDVLYTERIQLRRSKKVHTKQKHRKISVKMGLAVGELILLLICVIEIFTEKDVFCYNSAG